MNRWFIINIDRLFLFIMEYQNAISIIMMRYVNRCWYEILTFILRGIRISFTIPKLFSVLTRILPTCIISNSSDRFMLEIPKWIILVPFLLKIKMHITNKMLTFHPFCFYESQLSSQIHVICWYHVTTWYVLYNKMTYDKRGYTFLTEKKIIQLHIFFKCVWFKRCNLQRIDNFYSYSKVCVVTVSHNQHKSIKYKDWDCYTKKPYHLSNLSICSVDNVLIRWNQRSWVQAPAEDEVEFQYGEFQKTLYINL